MKALDMFCGVGGASMGLHRAGFKVVGVDINEQPDYPFEFYQRDATLLTINFMRKFELIWASPPCQAYSVCTPKNKRSEHPDLCSIISEKLIFSGVPYIIENVMPAPIRRDVVLCGEMFGLRVIRHRKFECSFPVRQPKHLQHKGYTHQQCFKKKELKTWYYESVHGQGGHANIPQAWQDAMEIHWTESRKSLAESIPPAYSEYIAREFLAKRPKQATMF